MTTSSHRESARIYAFTPRPRSPSNLLRQDGRAVIDLITHKAPAMPVIDFGESWYHQAAIKDSEKARIV